MRRVVITGLGAVTPIGNNVPETWNGILKKQCGIDEITLFDTTDMKVKLAAEVKINLEEHFDFKELKNNDRYTLFALLATKEAMKNANLDSDKIDQDRFGVILGSGIGGIETIQDTAWQITEKGVNRISPYFIPKSLVNIAAGSVAILTKAKGYVTSVVTACATGTNAIGDAFNRIRFGFEDVMIAGGAEASICKLGLGGFQAMKALSTSEDKNRASIPFDKERKGFVMGEGAGVLILEELEHAINRKANIIAEVVGYGVSCDAFHITAPSDDALGSIKAINNALKDAGISADKIDYINAHGTSTYLNDLTETKAIKKVFTNTLNTLKVSSTKSNTGHLLGAAGAVEAIFSALALKDGIIPPTINYCVKDEVCDLNIVPNEPIKQDIEYALSNSLGFGGHNASIILKKWSS